MSDLIERCESALPEQEREILIEAFEAVLGPRRTSPRPGTSRWHDQWFAFEKMLNVGAYVSAALTLIPQGWCRTKRVSYRKTGEVSIGMFDEHSLGKSATAATEALALAAIAIRLKDTE